MKKIISKLLLPAVILITNPILGDNVKTEAARVTKATVFLRGAQLTCSSDFVAQPGLNQFVFEGVSPDLDQNSLQATAKGNITIMDVKFQIRYNETAPTADLNQIDKRLKIVNDSLVMLNFEIEEMSEQLQSYITEKNILLNNRLLKGESLRDTLDMFQEGIAYLRARLTDISNASTTIKKKLYFKNNEKQNLEKRIQELNKINNSGKIPMKESIPSIVVMVYSELQCNAKVSISFFVDRAAWLPSYDLRANTNGTIDLNYKAELSQQTGMDWKNISITLSTGNPALNTQKPVLNPFYLSFVKKHRSVIREESGQWLTKSALQSATKETDLVKDEEMADAATIASYTEEREGMIQTEYDIKLKYTIPTDDELHVVAIQNKNLNSTYRYSSVPKLDMNAFLMAELSGLNELNLLAGSSRIYFDGSFIGRSVLNPDAFNDTISLSLGKDRNIIVKRKQLKDKTKEKLLVDEKTVNSSFELTIKNNKSTAINLDLTDQIPLSQDPNIKVSLIDGDGSTLNEETGLLSWKLSLKPYENKTIKFSYELRLPKSKGIAGL